MPAMTISEKKKIGVKICAGLVCLILLAFSAALSSREIEGTFLRSFVLFVHAIAAVYPIWSVLKTSFSLLTNAPSKISVESASQDADVSGLVESLQELAEKNEASFKNLQGLTRQVGAMSEMAQINTRLDDQEDLLGLVLKKSMETVGATVGTIMTLREEGDGLRIDAAEGWTPSLLGPIDPEETLAGKVLKLGKPLLGTDKDLVEKLDRANDSSRFSSSSFLIVPLKSGVRPTGVVCLSEKNGGGDFTEDDRDYLVAVLNQVAAAIDAARRLHEAETKIRLKNEEIQVQSLRILQAKKKIFQAEKLSSLGLLVSGVAHELNNPVTSILGFAELIRNEETPTNLAERIETIIAECHRARLILRNLQSFAYERAPEKKSTDLNALVENIVALRRYELGMLDIDLSTDLDPKLPPTSVDADRIQQAILNLLNNSVESMPPRGLRQVRVGTRRDESGDRLTLWISDTGEGIPEALKERVFDPFFTTKAGSRHSGLGLPLCQEIVQQHDGEMTLDSVPGNGTRVTVSLPVVAPEEGEETDPGESSGNSGFRVEKQVALVVDDEEPNAQVVAELLRSVGFRTEVSLRGAEALQRLMHEKFDLIVCDLLMPEIDGKRLFREIMKHHPGLRNRFIFTSGDTADPQTHLFAKNNDVRFVAKPFTRQEFLAAVEEQVAESQEDGLPSDLFQA